LEVVVGRPGNLDIVESVRPRLVAKLNKLRAEGAITDSVENGVRVPGYTISDITLSNDILSTQITVSPTPGINFALNTLVVVPTTISA